MSLSRNDLNPKYQLVYTGTLGLTPPEDEGSAENVDEDSANPADILMSAWQLPPSGMGVSLLMGIGGVGLLYYFGPTPATIRNLSETVGQIMQCAVGPLIRLREWRRRRRGSLVRIVASMIPVCLLPSTKRNCIAGYFREQKERELEYLQFYQKKGEAPEENDLYQAFSLSAISDQEEVESELEGEASIDVPDGFSPEESTSIQRRSSMSIVEVSSIVESAEDVKAKSEAKEKAELEELKKMIQAMAGSMSILVANEQKFRAQIKMGDSDESIDLEGIVAKYDAKLKPKLEPEEVKEDSKLEVYEDAEEGNAAEQQEPSSPILSGSREIMKSRRSSDGRTLLLNTLKDRHRALHSSEEDSSSDEEFEDA